MVNPIASRNLVGEDPWDFSIDHCHGYSSGELYPYSLLMSNKESIPKSITYHHSDVFNGEAAATTREEKYSFWRDDRDR